MAAVESRTQLKPAPGLSLGPDPLEEDAVKETRARALEPLTRRDRYALLAVGGSFLLVALLLAGALDSQRSPALWEAGFLVAVYAIVSRLEYEVGVGTVVPTQLVFVPMLFVFPLGWVPLLVLAGLTAGAAMDVARGRLHPERLALAAMDGVYALGPVLVLALAGEAAPRLADVPLYALALLAQLVVEFVSFAARDSIARGIHPFAQVRYTVRSAPIDLALAPLGLAVAFPASGDPLAVLLVVPLLWLLNVFAHERKARIDSALELGEAYRGTAFLLGDVVEADDAYTGMHSRDVVSLSLAVARELGLADRALRDVEFTALLHDVGKIRVPSEIVNKPGRLTEAEWAVMTTHTVEGQRMLERVGGLIGQVGLIVRSCHERWDGTGYPDRLAGDAIPPVARIVACCDAFSAMTTDRPYRSAMSVESAIEELRANSGTQFDPQVVDTLLRIVVRGDTLRPTS